MANPFCHIELNTDDPGKALAFYKKIFGWKYKAMPMGPGVVYTTFQTGTPPGGGIWKKPMPEAPTMWLNYVQVDDVKKTVAKARAAGAQVFVEYQPIPNMGAFGIFADPTGAALGVWEVAAKPAAKKPAAKKPAKKAPARKPAKKSKKR